MGGWTSLRKLAWQFAAVTFGSSALLLTGAVGAQAAAGYGPPVPGTTTVPGGYTSVVTSVTIGPAGGTIGPVRVGDLLVTLTIPAGAFPVDVQITLTAPNVGQIGSAGFSGYLATGGVGISIQENGAKYQGNFLKPLALSLASSSITSSSVVVVWNGSGFVRQPATYSVEGAAGQRVGVLSTTLDADPDFAVLTPNGLRTGVIPGATTSATGKPLLGEGILAGLLLAAGAGGLAFAGRRRLRARSLALPGHAPPGKETPHA